MLINAVGALENSLSKIPKQHDIDDLEIEYQKRIDILERIRQEDLEKLDGLKGELGNRDKDIGELMDRIANSQKSERLMESKYQSEIDHLCVERDKLNFEVQKLVADKERANAELSELNQKLSVLRDEQLKEQESRHELTCKIELLQEDNKVLSQKLHSFDQISVEKQQTIDLTNRALEERFLELNNLNLENESIKEKLRLETKRAVELEEVNRIIEMNLANQTLNFEQCKNEASNLYRTILELQNESKKLLEENSELKLQSIKAEAKLTSTIDLSSQYEALSKEHEIVLEEKNRVKAALLQHTDDLKSIQDEKSKMSLMLERCNLQKTELEQQLFTLKEVFKMFRFSFY